MVGIFFSIYKQLTIHKHHIMNCFHRATYFPPKSQLSRGGSWCPLCSCKSFIILKASAIYSAHPGEGVDKLHVTNWQMSAVETFLRKPRLNSSGTCRCLGRQLCLGCSSRLYCNYQNKTFIQSQTTRPSSPPLVSDSGREHMLDRQAKNCKSPL